MQGSVRFSMGQMVRAIILAIMFLASVDVFNRHQICILAAFVFFVITPGRKISIDYSLTILFGFSLSLFVFDQTFNGSLSNMVKAFNFPLCYLLGRSLFTMGKQENLKSAEKNVKTVIYVAGIGTFVHYFLNMIVNIGSPDREVVEFWSGQILSATGQAAYACIIIGVIAATLFSPDSGKTKKIMAIAALVIVALYNLVLSGRTLFILIAVSLLLAYFYKNYVKKINVVRTVIGLVIVVVALTLLYNANVFNVKTTFENSNFYNRFYSGDVTQEIDEDTRMEHKVYYITHLGDSLFGGGHIRAAYGHSAHDLYLDTYDESGIFAVVFIIAYILASLRRAYRCIKRKNIDLEIKLLVLCIYTIVNSMFFMEPIIRGNPWLLFSYCFIDGAVVYLLQYAKNDKPLNEGKII